MASREPCAAGCGRRVQIRSGTRPAGEATCWPCRRLGLGPKKSAEEHRATRRARQAAKPKVNACEHCGEPARNRFCSSRCAGLSVRVRPAQEPRATRRDRERTAPGLPARARRELLDRWRVRRRSCSYCPRLAETVDHVVPLILGGTNFEGNLAPCCRRCNASKAGLLLVEWRARRLLAA